MTLDIDFCAMVDDEHVPSAELLKNIDGCRETFSDPGTVEGSVGLRGPNDEECSKHTDPIVRMIDLWLRKVRWILAGDTETIAFRDSEYCFAFVPAGESVEVSFFSGDEAEIEEYVVEPTNIRLDAFVPQVLTMGERMVEIFKQSNPEVFDTNEACRDLVASLNDGQEAWKEHQIHNRRAP